MSGFLFLLAWAIGLLGSSVIGVVLLPLGAVGIDVETIDLGLPQAIGVLLGSLAVAGILGGLGSIINRLERQADVNLAIFNALTKVLRNTEAEVTRFEAERGIKASLEA